jgi:choline dehydrogenase
MIESGMPATSDINDPTQLPGVGIFPVTIDEQRRRVSTSLAYLTPDVRARDNLEVRTGVEVATIAIEGGRVRGVVLKSGEEVAADEVVVTAGAIWSAAMLLRSGVGPREHLATYGIEVHADLPVGSTMADHLGPGVLYRHAGPRGGVAGPAQVVCVGASDGEEVDYHLMPISLQDPARNPLTFGEKRRLMGRGASEDGRPGLAALWGAMKFFATPTAGDTLFMVAVFLLCSSGRGSVRLGATPDAAPVVVAPPLPDDGLDRLRHAFSRLATWERSAPFRALGVKPLFPRDLEAPDAVQAALETNTVSYGHMVGTCPMGPVLDADCRVHGIPNLRVADASMMPTIPRGNTYLGCVMVAERIARKIKAAA